jgi:type II secretory pathway component PulF
MPLFSYICRDRNGNKQEGAIEANDKRGAVMLLEQQGLVPVAIKEKSPHLSQQSVNIQDSSSAPKKLLSLFRKKTPSMNTREVLNFTSELSDLLASGMKLGTALNILAQRKTNSATDIIIATLRDEIIRGKSLSAAMGQFKETFAPLYVSLVQAGEAGGNLSEVMQRVVKHYERLQEVREKIVMAMVYPSIVILVGLGTLVFSMVFVIPKFALIFKDLNATLPLPTRMLMAMSHGLMDYGLILLAALVLMVMFIKRYLNTDAGRTFWHSLQLRLPIVRNVVTANAFTQFAYTLGMLVSNGVAILDALRIVEKTIQNTVIAAEIKNARERVTDGTTISGPLSAGKIFPQMLTDMLAIGEETGDMAGALSHIARRYEQLLDKNIKVLTTLLEPILIVLIAGMVGFVAISILMAVFDLTSGLHA